MSKGKIVFYLVMLLVCSNLWWFTSYLFIIKIGFFLPMYLIALVVTIILGIVGIFDLINYIKRNW